MLGWFAQQSQLSYQIYDTGASKSASVVSSGIINPVTGHRFVKSWLIDELIKVSTKTYDELGEHLGKKIIHQYPIWRHIPDVQAENVWSSRSMDPAYEGYLTLPEEETLKQLRFPDFHAWGIVKGGAVVDTNSLIELARKKWITDGVLTEERFDHSRLETGETGFIYESEKYKKVIMAGGIRDSANPWFGTDVYRPAKGEVLVCRIPGLYPDRVIKYKKFLVPLGEDLYWVGSNYQHDFNHDRPDPLGRKALEDWLIDGIGANYEVVNHLSGIRAATKHRRPLIGEHPTQKGLYLMNGLGTKGISLAPYFARLLINSIAKDMTVQETSAFAKAFHV